MTLYAWLLERLPNIFVDGMFVVGILVTAFWVVLFLAFGLQSIYLWATGKGVNRQGEPADPSQTGHLHPIPGRSHPHLELFDQDRTWDGSVGVFKR